ncbi:hypothetical protein [Kitasatospora paracochleata]|uniref:Uncharacterized protein n=1 Tax=Kitasatospora paracochleata TaxID=58354 RepID=A0ABT1JBC9_9ACTN|nr:hypothetical protein [Kitasatospora paracochleata]MCP2313976.1 hypothetical protein [Kitasatospora paracochleata]
MSAQPAEHGGGGRFGLPPMDTVQELRAALRAGHGFHGDAERLDGELAEQLLRRVPVDQVSEVDELGTVVDLAAVAEILAAYRGRVLLAADPEAVDAVDQAVAELLSRQGAE